MNGVTVPAESDPIIESARNGDRGALEQVLALHLEELQQYLARRLPTRLQATVSVEDLVQETLSEAFQKIPNLRDASVPAFSAWLKTIGVMRLMRQVEMANTQKRGGNFRRQHPATDSASRSLIDLLQQLSTDSITASRVAARQEGVAALRVAVAGLDKEQRRAIQLHLLQGKTLKETAKEMESTPDAVRGQVHRGKKKLADAMGRASMWLSQR